MYESSRGKTSPAIYVALIASWVIILGGVWWMFFRQPVDTPGTELVDEQTTRYFIGEQVLLEGTLEMSDDISQFSHLLTTKENTVFGVKSFDVVLNGFTGNVQIKGEVTGFKQQMPIIKVADVIGIKGEGTASSSGNMITKGYTYVKGASLGIDLSIFPGFTVTQLGNDIQLIDGTSKKLLTITPFVCTAGDPEKDCTVLKNTLEVTERFTNAAGMVFLNLPETKQRIAFDGKKQGYTLVAEPDVQLQTYASIFEVIDATLFDSRLDEMKTLCKDINSRLATITTHEVVIESDGTVQIGINGSTNAGVAANCVVSTSLADPTNLILTSYNGPSSPENTPTDSDDTATSGSTVPEKEPVKPVTDTSTTKIPVPAEYASWTTYPSVRGRTMYVEKNIISYDGVLRTGQAGCPYRLDLSYRTNATGAAADSMIFECSPTGASALKSAGWTTIGATTGAEFLRKDTTDSLKGVDVYIQ